MSSASPRDDYGQSGIMQHVTPFDWDRNDRPIQHVCDELPHQLDALLFCRPFAVANQVLYLLQTSW